MGVLLYVQLAYVCASVRKGTALVTKRPHVSVMLTDHGVTMSQRGWSLSHDSFAQRPRLMPPPPSGTVSAVTQAEGHLQNRAQALKLLTGPGTRCSHSCVLGQSESGGPAWPSRTWGMQESWSCDHTNGYFSVIHKLRAGEHPRLSCTGSKALVLGVNSPFHLVLKL